MTPTKVLTVHLERCVGCRICEIACSLEKEKVCNPRKARLKIVKDEEQGLDVPMICYHCEDAPCAAICPTKAITRASTGALVINYDSCIGCKICAVVCPYGAISINPDSRRMVKCDLCNGTPKCAQACPVDAIEYVKPQLFDVTARIDAARKIIKTHKLAS